jgi:hypothetical protein
MKEPYGKGSGESILALGFLFEASFYHKADWVEGFARYRRRCRVPY